MYSKLDLVLLRFFLSEPNDQRNLVLVNVFHLLVRPGVLCVEGFCVDSVLAKLRQETQSAARIDVSSGSHKDFALVGPDLIGLSCF